MQFLTTDGSFDVDGDAVCDDAIISLTKFDRSSSFSQFSSNGSALVILPLDDAVAAVTDTRLIAAVPTTIANASRIVFILFDRYIVLIGAIISLCSTARKYWTLILIFSRSRVEVVVVGGRRSSSIVCWEEKLLEWHEVRSAARSSREKDLRESIPNLNF